MMPQSIKPIVLNIDAFNDRIGRLAMYLLFIMMGILLWSSSSKTFL